MCSEGCDIMIRVLSGACGTGKTTSALEIALSGKETTLYVAPTRALAQQFSRRLQARGKTVYEALGRRTGENCNNPLADIAIATGESHTAVCKSCDNRETCDYWLSRVAVENLGVSAQYAVTTLHFIAFADIRPEAERIIYDDINSPVVVASGNQWGAANIKSIARVKRGKGKNTQIFLVPDLPTGKKETLVISATPVISFFRQAQEISLLPALALEQVVHYHFSHLTHSSAWLPPPGTCGFKKNTLAGMPYFNASTGLNDWRGMSLSVAGTFQPPLDYLFVLADLLTQIHQQEHVVDFVPCEILFDNSKPIRSAMWVIRNGTIVVDASCMPSIYPLVQLLGRAGVDVSCRYYGDLPLNFRLYLPGKEAIEIRLARETVLESSPPDIVAFHRNKWEAAVALHEPQREKRLSPEARKYLAMVKRVLYGVNQSASIH